MKTQAGTRQAPGRHQAAVGTEGMEREGGGSHGTLDCVIWGFSRAGSGLGPHRSHPGPFKSPPY